MSLEYLESNRWLKIDYLFGLRVWGLVLYGILPASLAALGVLKVRAVASKFRAKIGGDRVEGCAEERSCPLLAR